MRSPGHKSCVLAAMKMPYASKSVFMFRLLRGGRGCVQRISLKAEPIPKDLCNTIDREGRGWVGTITKSPLYQGFNFVLGQEYWKIIPMLATIL